jgi:hypothetical protein
MSETFIDTAGYTKDEIELYKNALYLIIHL